MDTIEEIYENIRVLITVLNTSSDMLLKKQLKYLMEKVAWTTGSELLEEIMKVLGKELLVNPNKYNKMTCEKINELILKIKDFLNSLHRPNL